MSARSIHDFFANLLLATIRLIYPGSLADEKPPL